MAFFVLLLLLIFSALGYRVYYRVFVTEINLSKVSNSGTVEEIELPSNLIRTHYARYSPEYVIPILNERVRDFIQSYVAQEKFEVSNWYWTIHYSQNSTSLRNSKHYELGEYNTLKTR